MERKKKSVEMRREILGNFFDAFPTGEMTHNCDNVSPPHTSNHICTREREERKKERKKNKTVRPFDGISFYFFVRIYLLLLIEGGGVPVPKPGLPVSKPTAFYYTRYVKENK